MRLHDNKKPLASLPSRGRATMTTAMLAGEGLPVYGQSARATRHTLREPQPALNRSSVLSSTQGMTRAGINAPPIS